LTDKAIEEIDRLRQEFYGFRKRLQLGEQQRVEKIRQQVEDSIRISQEMYMLFEGTVSRDLKHQQSLIRHVIVDLGRCWS
jgi:ABC-type hemin transport system ATPase subunit